MKRAQSSIICPMRWLLIGGAGLALSCGIALAEDTPSIPAPASVEAEAFAGKVKIHCAPMRLAAMVDAPAIAECDRSQLVQVVGTDGDFYVVEPPAGLKAYISSRYVSNHRIQGERVNLRARPNTESTILGQVNSGDEVQDRPLRQTADWVEIPFPAQRKLYMRKELIARVGDRDSFAQLQQQRLDILQALQNAVALAEKAYGQFKDQSQTSITWSQVRSAFDAAARLAASSPAFSEISQTIEISQQAAFDGYQKAFSDSAHSVPTPGNVPTSPGTPPTSHEIDTPWARVEQELQQKWMDANPEKSIEAYEQTEEGAAIQLEGTLRPFDRGDLRKKPGDFVLYQQNLPAAYLYSAKIDLAPYVGKSARYKVVKRDNLEFALPAYCVLSVEA